MTQRTYRRNIRAWYALASDGKRIKGAEWYPRARAHINHVAACYALAPEVVAHVVAALSPHCRQETNLQDAERYLATYADGFLRYLGPPSACGELARATKTTLKGMI